MAQSHCHGLLLSDVVNHFALKEKIMLIYIPVNRYGCDCPKQILNYEGIFSLKWSDVDLKFFIYSYYYINK